jgi:hypothetical protein
VRGLVGLVLAACLIGLAGPQPVHAGAEGQATTGVWINPKLGLATPEEAERLLTMPFHAWYFDGDPWIQQKHRWRERVYLIYDRPSWLTLKAGESWRVETCRDLLIAEDSALSLLFNPAGLAYPKTLLGWRWARFARHHCRILSHVARLRPVQTSTVEHPDFLAKAWTVRHLSPLAYVSVSMNAFCKKYRSEIEDTPHHHLRDKSARYPGPDVYYGLIHERPWDDAMRDGKRVWALWAQDPAVDVAGIKVSPRIRSESEESVLTFAVQAVGSLPGHERPVFVIKAGHDYKAPDCHSCPFFQVLVLSYEPEIEVFRAINLEDFEPYFMDSPYWRQRCLPQIKKPREKRGH